jgi:hypothetical protein
MLLWHTLFLLVYRIFQNVACTLAVPPFTGVLAIDVRLLLPAFLLLLALLLLLAGLRIRIRTQPGQWIRIRILNPVPHPGGQK